MIDLINISLQFGGKYLFNGVNFRINSGDRVSLVGANGTGKSSLLKIISGDLQPESGKVHKQKRINIGYLPQEHINHKGKTLLEEAKSALTRVIDLQLKEKEITEKLSIIGVDEEERDDLINQLGEVHHKLQETDSYSAESNVEKILIGLGFEEEDFEKLTDHFSGGWQMRIALAKILISQNDILLMDEPTNHLDIDSLQWLIGFLKKYKGSLLVVSHDKQFINDVTNRTLEIFLNKFYTYRGTYEDYLNYKAERDQQAESLYIQQQKKIKETERFIERFRYKSSKAKQVQSRIKQLEKVNLIELPESGEEINIRFPEPPASGKINIDLVDIYKTYGEKKIFEGINFQVVKGEKIAFVGPNGAGKTTLAKIIAGVTPIDKGERIPGHNSFISYYAQDVADNLDPELDIIETLEGINDAYTVGQLRSLLGSFLFHGDDVFKQVGVLSGGEKSRVALAKILLIKSNFIILDEPTNHLDISSKGILQKALHDFSGSLILVSHDVDFLKPIVSKVVEIRKGVIKVYDGGIEYYLMRREEEKAGQEEKGKEAGKEKELQVSKKDQKRVEAEMRQKRFIATKDVIKKIEKIEKEIEKYEAEVKEIEERMLDPKIYAVPEKIKEAKIEFSRKKEILSSKLIEWEELSLELDTIEKKFNI
jgi:ATP-binding cassette, subfamily F, member 3